MKNIFVFLICALCIGLFAIYLPKKIPHLITQQKPAVQQTEMPAIAEAEPGQPRPQAQLQPQGIAPPKPRILLNEVEEAKKYLFFAFEPLRKIHQFATGPLFKTPYPLQEKVEFWRNVFAKYEHPQSLVHDAEHLQIVYGVLDFSDLYDNPLIDEEEMRRVRLFAEEQRKNELRDLLLSFDEGYKPQSKFEWAIFNLFENIKTPRKFKDAALNVRSQWGQKDRFEEGLIRFGRYKKTLEEIFKKEGVPPEITRLTFVESMFRLDVVSKVGAAGPWQFMPDTGKKFLRINDVVDERYDPLIAGRAAAKFLLKNYELLESWPLAINAYNTGAKRLLKAKDVLHTDHIEQIVLYFKDDGYQFASRNFYPEFLAVLEVVNNYKNYFGNIELQTAIPYDDILLSHHTSIAELAKMTGTDLNVLKDLNPSLRPKIFDNGILPAGYGLRIPHGVRDIFLATIDLIREKEKNILWHVVGRKESLPSIAHLYNVALNFIKQLNGITEDHLKEGQVIKIPSPNQKIMLKDH